MSTTKARAPTYDELADAVIGYAQARKAVDVACGYKGTSVQARSAFNALDYSEGTLLHFAGLLLDLRATGG